MARNATTSRRVRPQADETASYGWRTPTAPPPPPQEPIPGPAPFFDANEFREIHDDILERVLAWMDAILPGPLAYLVRTSSGWIEWLVIWSLKTFVLMPALAPFFAARRAYYRAQFAYNAFSTVYPVLQRVAIFAWQFFKNFWPSLGYARQDFDDAASTTSGDSGKSYYSDKLRGVRRTPKKKQTWLRFAKWLIVLLAVLSTIGIASLILLCVFVYFIFKVGEMSGIASRNATTADIPLD